MTVYQTLAMVIYLIWREPGQLGCVLQNWRPSLWVGISGIAGSVGWFTAMTIQTAAYVRALGQIELLFTFLVSVFYFREKVNRLEALGISAIAVGLVYLLIVSCRPEGSGPRFWYLHVFSNPSVDHWGLPWPPALFIQSHSSGRPLENPGILHQESEAETWIPPLRRCSAPSWARPPSVTNWADGLWPSAP